MSQCLRGIAGAMIASIVLALVPGAAAALECRSSALRDRQHWSWREVDGRRCWYPGLPGLSKSTLRWPQNSVSPSSHQQTNGSAVSPPPSSDRGQDEFGSDSVWPPLPQNSFEERFVGAR